jgi:hypothetical protein
MATRCSFCGASSGPFSKVEGLFTVLRMPHRRPILYSLIPGCRGASREQSCEHRGFWSRPVADAFGAPVLRGLQRRDLITSQNQ